MNDTDPHSTAVQTTTAQGASAWLFRPESIRASLGFYVPATAAARAVGLLRGIILARLLSEREFGLFQLTILIITVLTPLCSLSLNEGLTRYVPLHEARRSLADYLRRMLPLAAGVALAMCAMVFAAAEPLGRLFYATVSPEGGGAAARLAASTLLAASTEAAWTNLARMVAATTFTVIVYFMLISVLRGLRMFRAISLLELLNNVVFTGATVFVAGLGWGTAIAMAACLSLTQLALVPLFAWPLRRSIRRCHGAAPAGAGEVGVMAPAVDDAAVEQQMPGFRPLPAAAGSLSGQLFRFGVWTAGAAVIWQTLQYYPMWFLQKTHGPDVTAIFAAVRLITQVVAVGAITIITVVQTSVTRTWETEGPEPADARLMFAYKATAALMLVGCVVFTAASEPIMRIYPAAYRTGINIVPLSLLFFLISAHLSFVAVHFALIEKMRQMFWPWLTGLAANAVAAAWLVAPSMPASQAIVGAAWAGVVGLSAAMLIAAVLLVRERRPVDAGIAIFWAAMYVLALPVALQAVAVVVLALLTLTSDVVFNRAEKQTLRRAIVGLSKRG